MTQVEHPYQEKSEIVKWNYQHRLRTFSRLAVLASIASSFIHINNTYSKIVEPGSPTRLEDKYGPIVNQDLDIDNLRLFTQGTTLKDAVELLALTSASLLSITGGILFSIKLRNYGFFSALGPTLLLQSLLFHTPYTPDVYGNPSLLEDLYAQLLIKLQNQNIPVEEFADMPLIYILPQGNENARGYFITDRSSELNITSSSFVSLVGTDVIQDEFSVIDFNDYKDNSHTQENYIEMLQQIPDFAEIIQLPVKTEGNIVYEVVELKVYAIDFNGVLRELDVKDFELREYKQGVYKVYFKKDDLNTLYPNGLIINYKIANTGRGIAPIDTNQNIAEDSSEYSSIPAIHIDDFPESSSVQYLMYELQDRMEYKIDTDQNRASSFSEFLDKVMTTEFPEGFLFCQSATHFSFLLNKVAELGNLYVNGEPVKPIKNFEMMGGLMNFNDNTLSNLEGHAWTAGEFDNGYFGIMDFTPYKGEHAARLISSMYTNPNPNQSVEELIAQMSEKFKDQNPILHNFESGVSAVIDFLKEFYPKILAVLLVGLVAISLKKLEIASILLQLFNEYILKIKEITSLLHEFKITSENPENFEKIQYIYNQLLRKYGKYGFPLTPAPKEEFTIDEIISGLESNLFEDKVYSDLKTEIRERFSKEESKEYYKLLELVQKLNQSSYTAKVTFQRAQILSRMQSLDQNQEIIQNT